MRMITVADVMKLPSMYGATILAGHAGISNPVESVTVLEYGQITSTLDELFSQTEFQENALIISSFATIADDVDAQCENIRRYHAIGCVGFILFYIGLILPSVDDRVIACCNELDLVLITMPGDIRTHKYSDVIGDIYHAIFKDQQAGSNYVSTLIRRFSNLPAEQRNTSTLLRMLSNHLQASIILTDYKKSISNIACWPQSLSELLSKELKKQLQKMQGKQAVKISYDDSVGYLQHCPTLLEGKEGFDLYTFKYNELLSREDLWQASEFVQLYSHIWNKDLGKLVTSELVRAIIDDDPLKMRRLADLFQINVAELNQMWVFDSVDSSEPDLKSLRKCTEYFSGIYKTVLVGYYESNIPAKTISINVNGISGTSSSRDYISNLGRGRHFGCLVLPYANAAARNSKRRYEIVLHSRGSTKQGSVQIIRILSGGEICLNCRNNACTIGLSVDCNDNYVIVELSFKNHHIIITIANGCSAVCNCIV